MLIATIPGSLRAIGGIGLYYIEAQDNGNVSISWAKGVCEPRDMNVRLQEDYGVPES